MYSLFYLNFNLNSYYLFVHKNQDIPLVFFDINFN